MKPFRTGPRATLALISIALMTACSTLGEYDITVNDVTVYEPGSPLRVDGIEDTALRNCLQQTADDIVATEPRDIMSLNCSDEGITSLAGLSQFDQIRLLKLDDNAIRNLLELGRLEALEQLWLNDNDIIDAIPVLGMSGLRTLHLQGNPRLQCPPPDRIPPILQLTLPEHCTAP
tara:strand:+ start:143 stop:667 length:525 start_codon:yes stop_codon:yes gene_type:complete